MVRACWTVCGLYCGLALWVMLINPDEGMVVGKILALIAGFFGGVALIETDHNYVKRNRH